MKNTSTFCARALLRHTEKPRYVLQRWGCPTVHFISDLVAAKSLDAELMRTYYSAPGSIRLGPRSGVVVPQGVTWTDVAGRFRAKPAEVQQDPLGTWLIFFVKFKVESIHSKMSN